MSDDPKHQTSPTTRLTAVVCSECGIQFGLPTAYYNARQADHKAFRCPNNHVQHFPRRRKEPAPAARSAH